MKDELSVFELLTKTVQDAIDTVNAGHKLTFRELCDALQLDPKNDFRHSDLSYVDFSDSNLKGFDFTGSDLKGAFGINVTLDSTTVLLGCDTAESLFSAQRRREEFFKSQDNEREYQLFKKNEWSNLILSAAAHLGVHIDIKKMKRPTLKGIMFCERLLLETTDSTITSNILFFMSNIKSNSEEYFELLLEIVAMFGDNVRLMRSVITIMSDFFYNKRPTIGIFVRYLESDNIYTVTAAVKGIARSRYFSDFAEIVVRAIAGKGEWGVYLRQVLLSEVAKRKGPDYRESIVDSPRSVIDYEVPIDKDMIATIARHYLQDKGRNLSNTRNIYVENTSVSRLEAEVANVQSRLRDLENLGIPFQFVSSSQEMSAATRGSAD
jgi:hypothetical protein